MKKLIVFATMATLIFGCSAPKYSYYFDTYDYNSGKKKPAPTTTETVAQTSSDVFAIDPSSLTASNTPAPLTKSTPAFDKAAVTAKLKSMSKTERQELKKELKTELKKVIKARKHDQKNSAAKAQGAWDYDLKMAAIFGAIGLVLSALGGVNSIFWVLGVIALVVAIVFLIKWLSRQ